MIAISNIVRCCVVYNVSPRRVMMRKIWQKVNEMIIYFSTWTYMQKVFSQCMNKSKFHLFAFTHAIC